MVWNSWWQQGETLSETLSQMQMGVGSDYELESVCYKWWFSFFNILICFFCVSSYLATASLHSPSLFGFFLSIFLLGRGNFSTLVILVNQSANQTAKHSVNQSILDKFSTFGILFTNRSILPPSIIPTIRPRSIILNQIKSCFFCCQHLFPLFNTCSHLFFHTSVTTFHTACRTVPNQWVVFHRSLLASGLTLGNCWESCLLPPSFATRLSLLISQIYPMHWNYCSGKVIRLHCCGCSLWSLFMIVVMISSAIFTMALRTSEVAFTSPKAMQSVSSCTHNAILQKYDALTIMWLG